MLAAIYIYPILLEICRQVLSACYSGVGRPSGIGKRPGFRPTDTAAIPGRTWCL